MTAVPLERYRHLYDRTAPYCMGFRNLHSPLHEVTWVAQPVVPFRVEGLLLWGATRDSWITNIQVRHTRQLIASSDPIPALFFATGLSFLELLSQVVDDDGKLLPLRASSTVFEPPMFFHGWLKKNPKVDPRQIAQLDTLSLGDQLTIQTKGPLYQLVVWGKGLRDL